MYLFNKDSILNLSEFNIEPNKFFKTENKIEIFLRVIN